MSCSRSTAAGSPSETGSIVKTGTPLCAGLTVDHALLRGTARPGSTAGILGIGGHLGIQYVDKMGLNTIAIARGHQKEKLSRQIGAGHYIDAQDSGKAAVALGDLSGADLIIATASSRASSSALIGGLATNGKLIVLGASKEPVTATTGDLIGRGIPRTRLLVDAIF